MAYTFIHLYGEMDHAPLDTIAELLRELDNADDEHFEVAVSHESGWVLSLTQSGKLVLENVEDPDIAPRHLRGVSRAECEVLMRSVAMGDFEQLEPLSWQDGYPR